VSLGQAVQFDERSDPLAAGQFQLRRAPRKEDLVQLAMTEQRVQFVGGDKNQEQNEDPCLSG